MSRHYTHFAVAIEMTPPNKWKVDIRAFFSYQEMETFLVTEDNECTFSQESTDNSFVHFAIAHDLFKKGNATTLHLAMDVAEEPRS